MDGPASVILDMDGYECSRNDVCEGHHDIVSFLAWKRKSTLKPRLFAPMDDDRFDRFFFPLEVAWCYSQEWGTPGPEPTKSRLCAFPFAYHDLTRSGKRTFQYLLTHKILPKFGDIFSMKGKGYKSYPTYDEIGKDLFVTVSFIFYKGGHYERDLANCLGLPSANLETWGVPKLTEYSNHIESSGHLCPLHKDRRNPHCPSVEVVSHRKWCKQRAIHLPDIVKTLV